MFLTYENLTLAEMHGFTLADYLIALEADFRIFNGDSLVYGEIYFPVAELARALNIWVTSGGEDDFLFDSMSFEDLGGVAILRRQEGWVFGSLLPIESLSTAVEWSDIQEGIANFVGKIRADIIRLGIDPANVFEA